MLIRFIREQQPKISYDYPAKDILPVPREGEWVQWQAVTKEGVRTIEGWVGVVKWHYMTDSDGQQLGRPDVEIRLVDTAPAQARMDERKFLDEMTLTKGGKPKGVGIADVLDRLREEQAKKPLEQVLRENVEQMKAEQIPAIDRVMIDSLTPAPDADQRAMEEKILSEAVKADTGVDIPPAPTMGKVVEAFKELDKTITDERERLRKDPPARVGVTDDPNDPDVVRGGPDEKPVAQHKKYLVLSKEERKKGWVRPLRRKYVHVGLKPVYPLRDLTPEEQERFNTDNPEPWVKFEPYPKSTGKTGRFWTQKDLDNKGCGALTTMGLALCETYARDPGFYGSTYCCGCSMHRPVAEFVWDEDGEVVGS